MVRFRKTKETPKDNTSDNTKKTLFDKHNYLNKSIPYLKNTTICEYDMHDAGMTIITNEKLLDNDTIQWLKKLDKKTRHIQVGYILRDNKEVSKLLMENFIKIRNKFAELNDIKDSDVLSIKKDAIFLIDKTPEILEFDNYKFVLKSKFSSYYYINKKEFYYNSYNDTLVVKGLGKEIIARSKDYFLNDIKMIIRQNEKMNYDQMFNIIQKYREKYLTKSLNINHYRELNLDNSFRLNSEFILINNALLIEEIHESDINIIDIEFNYINYLLPMIGLIL